MNRGVWFLLIIIGLVGAVRESVVRAQTGPSRGTWSRSFADLQAVADDEVPWSVQNDRPTVAIGDLHGDLRALIRILQGMGMVDAQGQWSGQNVNLVLTGDILNGAGDSRLLIEYLMRLQQQIPQTGGAVFFLLGNHEMELAAGDEGKMPATDAKKFLKYPLDQKPVESVRAVFQTPNSYSRWLTGFQLIVRINGVFFVHAGLLGWLDHMTPGQINSIWREVYQNHVLQGQPIPSALEWIFDPRLGPAYTQEFDPDGSRALAMKRKHLRRILQSYASDLVVKGHNPTRDSLISTYHPYFRDKVVTIDTGISESKGGQLSALRISPETGANRRIETFYFDRPEGDDYKPERKRILRKLKNRCSAVFW